MRQPLHLDKSSPHCWEHIPVYFAMYSGSAWNIKFDISAGELFKTVELFFTFSVFQVQWEGTSNGYLEKKMQIHSSFCL